MKKTVSEILTEQLALVVLDLHRWAGAKRLRGADLLLDPTRVPPKKVATLGSKFVFDRDDLAWASRLFSQARNACSEVGVKLMGGYAVPLPLLQGLCETLDALADEFNTQLSCFLESYDEKLEAFLAGSGEWKPMLTVAICTRDEVGNRYQFSYDVTHLAPVQTVPVATQRFENRAERLGDQLMTEIAAEARKSWEKSFAGRDKVSHKALHVVERIRDKLRGLVFLDPRAYPLAENIEGVLAALPKRGCIAGRDLAAVTGLILTLAEMDESLLCRVAEANAEVEEVEDGEAAEDTAESGSAREGSQDDPHPDDETDLPILTISPTLAPAVFQLFL